MKFPKYLTKAYIKKTYGSLSGIGDFEVKLTKFSKTATTLKATVELSSSFGDSTTDILMKVGKTTTSLAMTIDYGVYKAKLSYSTEQTKKGVVIKSTFTDGTGSKVTYRLDIEKDGDFSKFKMVYGTAKDFVTITSSKVSGDVVTFKAVDEDGKLVGTAKIDLKAFGDYYSKTDKYLFDSSKTADLFSKVQIKFSKVKKAEVPDGAHDGDSFLFSKKAAGDHDDAGASHAVKAAHHFAFDDVSASGSDSFDFLAAHDFGQPAHASKPAFDLF